MASPWLIQTWGLRVDPFEQAGPVLMGDMGDPVFTPLGAFHAPSEHLGEQLDAVADAEYGHAKIVYGRIGGEGRHRHEHWRALR